MSPSAQNERTGSSHLGHGARSGHWTAATSHGEQEGRGGRAHGGIDTSWKLVKLVDGPRKWKELETNPHLGCVSNLHRRNSTPLTSPHSITSSYVLLTTNQFHWSQSKHRFIGELPGISNLGIALVLPWSRARACDAGDGQLSCGKSLEMVRHSSKASQQQWWRCSDAGEQRRSRFLSPGTETTRARGRG